MKMCSECGGTGKKQMPFRKSCGNCFGTGRINGAICGPCGGTGLSQELETIPCGPCRGTGVLMDTDTIRDPGPPLPHRSWTPTQFLILVICYVLSVWLLVRDGTLQGWWPYVLAIIPAYLVAAAWKALLYLAVLGVAAWYGLPYLYHLFDY